MAEWREVYSSRVDMWIVSQLFSKLMMKKNIDLRMAGKITTSSSN